MSESFGSRSGLRKAGMAGFVVAVFASLMLMAPSAFGDSSIPGSPLQPFVTDQLQCQLIHVEVAEFDSGDVEEPPENYCATLAFSDDNDSFGLYGDLDFTNRNFYPVTQDSSGTGTAADPYTITTVVQAEIDSSPALAAAPVSPSLLTITQVDSYVNGDDFFRTDVTVHNDLNANQDVTLYHVGDCRLEGDDFGLADLDSDAGPVFCTPDVPVDLETLGINTASSIDDPAILGFIPVGNDSTLGEAEALNGTGALYDDPKAGDPFPDKCADCESIPGEDEPVDNGVGLSWQFSMAPGASERRCFYTVDSWDGNEPDVPASCVPGSNPPATIAQQPPPKCKLRISRARVFLFARHPRLRLVARYRSADPADVQIKFDAIENGNTVHLGDVTRHFNRHGLFRLREEITQDQSDTLWETHKFVVHFKIPGEPGFCERQYRKDLTKPRIVDGQRVVFQSDSHFPQPGAGHPEHG
jgi:hypothetical protein